MAPKRNYAPAYIRGLIAQSGLTQEACAGKIGVSFRSLKDYIAESHNSAIPYAAQVLLEDLAARNQLDKKV